RHWRYSVLAGAAVVEREAALARLARAGLSEAELLAAWTAAPEDLRAGHGRMVDAWLRGDGSELPLPDWAPLYARLALRDPGKRKDAWRAPLSPAQAAVRDYFFARELNALIIEHMTRPGYATPVEAGAWVLDHRPDMARFYPERASDQEVYGKSLALCTLTQDGGLTDCKSIADAPPDYGFGAAAERALPLTWRLRMDSVPADAVGKRVRVVLNWTLG
ncbi:hypothetical protein G3573_20505, partial [Caulobacter sp. 17J65-9]|nr:hypothetical protein [Caulobacter sp. 17J65-9]